jgi:transposase
MSYLQVQRNQGRGSRQLAYVHLAHTVWLPEKKGAAQRRLDLGRLKQSGTEVIISKGIRIERKPHAIAMATARMGYTVVLRSQLGASAEEALLQYRCKDRVEKLFDMLKNELDQRRLHAGLNESLQGRLVVPFAALILHAALEEKMRQAALLRKTRVAEVLAQLHKIKAVRTRTGRRFLLEISKRHRQLLADLGIPLPT